MDKNNGKVKLDDEQLDQVAGGSEGEKRFIFYYLCPKCGGENRIYAYCTSGESKWICDKCECQYQIKF